MILGGLSLSARRAWIEIFGGAFGKLLVLVALRKESVDRNLLGGLCLFGLCVALRKESVDRNHVVLVVPGGCWRRSPQGERG